MTTNKKAALAGTGTASKTFDSPNFKQASRIRLVPLPSTIATYPMPPALSDDEICQTAAPLGRASGFLVLSWPDGVRAAVDRYLTAAEGIAVYRAARRSIEAIYRQLAGQAGGRA
ncbi:MAG: hypothetical protein KBD39_04380 [Sterolibacterium sp.]|jgi:hypothetical protein|nr:hypothetical protein [Sterolibacterium sp.]MBP9799335.1 hypothetical protein [Sterolibacterium sp.]